jgi:phenylpropionate dioxygenase-like ring-hydroxylating dioxygenase large terminal subunit
MVVRLAEALRRPGMRRQEQRLEHYHHYETRVPRREMNWKLAIDTFCETYHLSYLHPDTDSPLFHTNRATFDAFGRNEPALQHFHRSGTAALAEPLQQMAAE